MQYFKADMRTSKCTMYYQVDLSSIKYMQPGKGKYFILSDEHGLVETADCEVEKDSGGVYLHQIEGKSYRLPELGIRQIPLTEYLLAIGAI